MNNIIIDIASYLDRDLKSRISVKNLYNTIKSKGWSYFTIDFKNVDFASRSFMDEFYNQFIINNEFNVVLVNLSPDLKKMIVNVASTQYKKKRFRKSFLSKSDIKFESISEANEYLEALSF